MSSHYTHSLSLHGIRHQPFECIFIIIFYIPFELIIFFRNSNSILIINLLSAFSYLFFIDFNSILTVKHFSVFTLWFFSYFKFNFLNINLNCCCSRHIIPGNQNYECYNVFIIYLNMKFFLSVAVKEIIYVCAWKGGALIS